MSEAEEWRERIAEPQQLAEQTAERHLKLLELAEASFPALTGGGAQ